jgi:hypothetical protein
MKRTQSPPSRRPAIEPTKDFPKPIRPAWPELPMEPLEVQLALIRIQLALLLIRSR